MRKWSRGGLRHTLIERVVTAPYAIHYRFSLGLPHRLYANAEPVLLRPRLMGWRNTRSIRTTTMWISLRMRRPRNWPASWLVCRGVMRCWGCACCDAIAMDFAGAYVASMLAAGAASLVIMLLADWMLPLSTTSASLASQASVLVWLFWGLAY